MYLIAFSISLLSDDNQDVSTFNLMKKMINFELLMKPTFFLVGASSLFAYFAYFIPLFYIPDLAVVNGGIERNNANFLLSIGGELENFNSYFH